MRRRFGERVIGGREAWLYVWLGGFVLELECRIQYFEMGKVVGMIRAMMTLGAGGGLALA